MRAGPGDFVTLKFCCFGMIKHLQSYNMQHDQKQNYLKLQTTCHTNVGTKLIHPMFVGWHLTNLGQPLPQTDTHHVCKHKSIQWQHVLITYFFAQTFRQMRIFLSQCVIAVEMHVANGQRETTDEWQIREKASANHMAHMAEGVKFARILVRYILYEQFCPEFEPAKCHFSLFYLHTHFTNGEEQQAGTQPNTHHINSVPCHVRKCWSHKK